MGAHSLKMQKDLLRWATRRARERSITISLSYEDIYIPRFCPVLGIPLYTGDGYSCDNSPTLDRIVPEVGYVPGNIIVISNRANRIKSNASWVELRRLVEFYEEYISQVWMQNDPETGTPITIH